GLAARAGIPAQGVVPEAVRGDEGEDGENDADRKKPKIGVAAEGPRWEGGGEGDGEGERKNGARDPFEEVHRVARGLPHVVEEVAERTNLNQPEGRGHDCEP